MKATNPVIFYLLAFVFTASFAASVYFFFSASNKTKEPTDPFSFDDKDGEYSLFLQPHRFTEEGKKHRTLHFIFGGLMMLSGFLMFLGEN